MSKFEKVVEVMTSVGAAIVIFGAWQKITHQSSADLFLTIGLLTEAVIFVLYAILSVIGSKQPETMPTREYQATSVAPTQATQQEFDNLTATVKQLNGLFQNILKAIKG